MLTINEMPASLLAGVKTNFNEGREMYIPNAKAFVEDIPSNLKIENYVMFGAHIGPQEFKGETRYSKLREFSYFLENKKYFDALEIDIDLIVYEQTGQIEQRARNFGYEWERGADKMLWEQLTLGASLNCYDGTPFFGASHLDGDSGVQVNLATGGSILDSVTLRIMQAAFAGFKDDRGEIMGRKLTHIVTKTGSASAISAKTLANSQFAPNGTLATNIFQGAFEVIESPYVPTAVQFIGLDLSTPVKPIVRQLAGGLEFTAQERGSDAHMNHEMYRYKTVQRWGIGYSDWRLAYLQL